MGVAPFFVPWAPFWALGTEVVCSDPRVQQLNYGSEFHTAGRLVLIYRSPSADGIVHELVKCARFNYLNLQRGNGLVGNPALTVNAVEGFLDGQATVLKHRRRDGSCTKTELPIENIVTGDARGVGIAGVLNERYVERLKMIYRILHCILELHFVRLVRIDAEDHILPAYEVKLGGLVLESGNSQHISNSIAI